MIASAILRGSGWMCATAFLFALTDVFAKHLGEQGYPNAQILWGRFFFNFLVVMLVFAPRLGQVVRTQQPWLQLTRALLLVGTTGLIFFSFRTLSLVTANAVFFLQPVVVTVLAIPLLHERVDARTWTGALIGFAGAMAIIRPGTGMMQAAALLPLGAAVTSALYQIATHRASFTDSAFTSIFYAALGGTLVMTVLAPFDWRTPDAPAWGCLIAVGILGGAAQMTMIHALGLAAPSRIAPFIYTNLVWAALLGYAVFGDVPDRWTVVGGLLIATSGLYVLRRGAGE